MKFEYELYSSYSCVTLVLHATQFVRGAFPNKQHARDQRRPNSDAEAHGCLTLQFVA